MACRRRWYSVCNECKTVQGHAPKNITISLRFYKNCIGYLYVCDPLIKRSFLHNYIVLKGLARNYLQELLKLRCPGRTLRSSSLSILDKPLSQTVTYGDRRFAVAAANCWNPLPNEVKNAESLASFRRQLKTHLFKQAFLI